MIKNSTKKALLEVDDFTRRGTIVCGLSTVYYTIHALCSQGDVILKSTLMGVKRIDNLFK